MKDIVITVKRIRRELTWFGAMFVIAFALNIFAIIAYDGKWTELFMSLGFVLTTAVALYLVVAVLRIVVNTITGLTKNKR